MESAYSRAAVSPLRIWKATAVALAGSLIGNEVVRAATGAVFGISPAFGPLSHGPIVFWTIVGVIGAGPVRIGVAGTQRPAQLFVRIAIVVLLLSLIPDVLLLVTRVVPGTTPPEVAALMSMHVLTAGICVGLLQTPSEGRQAARATHA